MVKHMTGIIKALNKKKNENTEKRNEKSYCSWFIFYLFIIFQYFSAGIPPFFSRVFTFFFGAPSSWKQFHFIGRK